MKLEMIKKSNYINEIDVNVVISINGKKYNISGWINYQDSEHKLEIMPHEDKEIKRLFKKGISADYVDLYDFCNEDCGFADINTDYQDIVDYIFDECYDDLLLENLA